MTGDRPVLAGLLLVLLIAVTPPLLFGVALRLLPALVEAVRERRHRRRIVLGPSLESVVATLHRLRREIRGPAPPTQVRRLAVLAAYDETLLELCRVVGVDAALAAATGDDRAFARLVTEAELEYAGIVLDPPAGGGAAAA